MTTNPVDSIRPIDQTVLELLRQHRGLTVQELTDFLEVTATAVRQRLDRLVESDLIERRKEGEGRGRPTFRYFLTQLGLRYSSASYVDLASALWQEIVELPNPQLRGRLLRRVAKRMASSLSEKLPADGDLSAKMDSMVTELNRRKISAIVNQMGELPVLEVLTCPYPALTGEDDQRQLCELEQEMLSEAIGQSIQLNRCRLDGHDHCQFRPVPVESVNGKSAGCSDVPSAQT